MISPNWVLTTRDGRISPESDSVEPEPIHAEPEDQVEMMESEDQVEMMESKDQVEMMESEDQVEMMESEDQVEMMESEDQVEMMESEDQVEMMESEDQVEAKVMPDQEENHADSQEIDEPDKSHESEASPHEENTTIYSAHRIALQQANQERKEAYNAWKNSLKSKLHTMQQEVTDLLEQYQSTRTNR